jgi:hypothetical protein
VVGKPRLVRRRNGKLYWVWEDGMFAPPIAGGAPDPTENDSGGDEDPDDDSEDDDEEDDDTEASGSFTQDQVNRFLSKERKKTKRSVERDIAEQLGMPIADAKKALEDLAEGRKPEAQAALDRRSAELDKREVELEKLKLSLTVRERLQEQGVRPERLRRAVKLVELDDDEPDDDDILAAIDELKQDMPELFAQPKPPDNQEDDDDEGTKPRRRRAPSSDPATPPRSRRKPPEDAFALGAEKAKQFASTSFL